MEFKKPVSLEKGYKMYIVSIRKQEKSETEARKAKAKANMLGRHTRLAEKDQRKKGDLGINRAQVRMAEASTSTAKVIDHMKVEEEEEQQDEERHHTKTQVQEDFDYSNFKHKQKATK
ncbi:hypothetical protein BGW37DRAFT_516879 [Umbelopsis sp. PMI_123]|nr:hypothetical protein BGW37DRAFT_516879 [Umbelopsis sp. PMI_123]